MYFALAGPYWILSAITGSCLATTERIARKFPQDCPNIRDCLMMFLTGNDLSVSLANFLLESKKNFSYSVQIVSVILYQPRMLSIMKFSNRLEVTRFDIQIVNVSGNRFSMLKAGLMLKQFVAIRCCSITSFLSLHTIGNKGWLFPFNGLMSAVKAVRSVFTF